jgi:hypothetical protein
MKNSIPSIPEILRKREKLRLAKWAADLAAAKKAHRRLSRLIASMRGKT